MKNKAIRVQMEMVVGRMRKARYLLLMVGDLSLSQMRAFSVSYCSSLESSKSTGSYDVFFSQAGVLIPIMAPNMSYKENCQSRSE